MEHRIESKNLFRTHHIWSSHVGGIGGRMEIKLTLGLLLGLLIVLSAILFFHEHMALKSKVDGLEQRMVKLEQAKNKRMPYEAFESILDARAALNKEKEEFQFFVSLIENAEAHLEKAVTVGTKRDTTEINEK